MYSLAYNEQYPVICFDERPCFLIGDTVKGLDMAPGQVAKENYSYSKHGSCCVLAAIEPLTGQRFAHVRAKRRKKEFALFIKALCEQYPKAKRLRIVLDNLNTHGYHSFYEVFDAETAAQMTQKIFHDFKHKNADNQRNKKVITAGFEPATVCLEGRCSIQLSYVTLIFQY